MVLASCEDKNVEITKLRKEVKELQQQLSEKESYITNLKTTVQTNYEELKDYTSAQLLEYIKLQDLKIAALSELSNCTN